MAGQYGGNYGLSQCEFDPEQDLKGFRVWLWDGTHTPKPWLPLTAWLWIDGCGHGLQYGGEMICMPETKGFAMRVINGYLYLTAPECRPDESYLYLSDIALPLQIPKRVDLSRIQSPDFRCDEFFTVTKPEDVPTREQVFRERVKPILDDFDGEWKTAMDKWTAEVDYFKERCHPERLKQISNVELWELLEDCLVRIHRGWWAIHFIWMYPVYGIYNLFADLCEQLTGIDLEHPTFKALLGGFDNALFQVNRELWGLGDRARELGLADLFLTTADDEELMAKLGQSDAGRNWLQDYGRFVNRHGWRLIDTWEVATPSWIEQPHLGLRDVKAGIAKGGVFALDAERERLVKVREEAEREVLAKVPSEQKEWFTKLMRVAQKCGVFSEEHNLFMDVPGEAILRHLFIEYGRRFAKAGVIDKEEDILFLFPEEIRKAAVCMERIDLRPYVERRRKEWEENCKVRPEPFIGDIAAAFEVARKDPLARVVAVPPRVRPELKADLYGASSIPGVVEGIARVVMTERELDTVQPGEILVAPCTSVPWTPIFSIISGVVTDSGAMLSHAAIVAREFGIPAVVGTIEATGKIKTGDRIRVDGTNNAVYILGQ